MTTWDHSLDETPYTWADYQTFRAWYAGDPRRTDTLDAHRARRLCLMVDGLAERSEEMAATIERQAASIAALEAVVEAARTFSDTWERWKWGPDPDWDDVLTTISFLQDALAGAR